MGQNTFMRNSETRGEVADSRALQTQENPREGENSSLTMITVALGAPSKGDESEQNSVANWSSFYSLQVGFEYCELF